MAIIACRTGNISYFMIAFKETVLTSAVNKKWQDYNIVKVPEKRTDYTHRARNETRQFFTNHRTSKRLLQLTAFIYRID